MALSSSQTPTPDQASVHHQNAEHVNEPSWQIKLLYDGDCPLCMREVNFLKKRNADRGRVAFVNIAADDYDPQEHQGIDYETAMGRIHGILPDGTVVKNVEVFRRVYEALDMGWVYALTRLPVIGAIANWIYELWADQRLALTGRPNLDQILKQREHGRSPQSTDDTSQSSGRCRIDS